LCSGLARVIPLPARARLHPPGCVVFGKTCSQPAERVSVGAMRFRTQGAAIILFSLSLSRSGWINVILFGHGVPLLGGMPNIFIVRHARHDDGESQFCHSSALVKRVQISYWGSQVDYVMEVSLPTNDNGIPIKRTVNRFYYCVYIDAIHPNSDVF
jgi:hypothetical protein